jgi:CRISPR-associated protein Cas5d
MIDPSTGQFRPDEKEEKYTAMFARRADKGQHFTMPYLGCREFSCHDCRRIKDPSVEPMVRDEKDARLIGEHDLGWMLYDMDYKNPDSPSPMFFRAVLKDGAVEVPHPDREEVRG